MIDSPLLAENKGTWPHDWHRSEPVATPVPTSLVWDLCFPLRDGISKVDITAHWRDQEGSFDDQFVQWLVFVQRR